MIKENFSILNRHAIINVNIGIAAYKSPALEDVVISKPKAMKIGKKVNINIPIIDIWKRSFFSNFTLRKVVEKINRNIKPVIPYLIKLNRVGSNWVTRDRVKTNVVPPSIADKDEHKQPNKKIKKVCFSILGTILIII